MFVIVRHGDTFAPGEPARRIGARSDPPLTPAGEDQARALGAHFAALGWRFARVLVSPLARTTATARLILERQPIPPPTLEPRDWLREIDHGPDEDRPEAAVIARIGAAALAAWDARALPPPGWIVAADMRLAAWRALFAERAGADRAGAEPTLLVTSNGAARFALLADPALASARHGTFKLPTGGYGVIRRGADGGLEVPVWGQRP